MKGKKTRSVQYALRWRPVGNQWRLVCNQWRLVCNQWRLVGGHQTSESECHSKKKGGAERPYGTPCRWHRVRSHQRNHSTMVLSILRPMHRAS